MGQVECKPPEVRCKPRRAAGGELEDDEVGQVTDDPEILVQYVKTSWGMIPAERTGPPPPPPGDPSQMTPDVLKSMVPHTFLEMASFNAGVMLGPDAPQMKMLQPICTAMPKLVAAAGDKAALKRECATLSASLVEFGVTTDHVASFRGVMLASLRSLLPRHWDPQHEVAWNWFWTNACKNVCGLMGIHASIVQSSWAKIKVPDPTSPMKPGSVPETFPDMAGFNMMFLGRPDGPDMTWTSELFPQMANLVAVVDKPSGLDAICKSLGEKLKEKGVTPASIAEFQTVLLATMRALNPNDWDAAHEAAWTWFWDNVSRRLCLALV